MRYNYSKLWSRMLVLALASMGFPASQAGVTTINFNGAVPADLYRELGNGAAELRPTGGASGGAADGYLAITDAKGGQQTCLVFKDLEAGLVVKAFTFEADLRIGGGTARPADGISINYVRAGDPLLTNADNGVDPSFTDFAGTDGERALPEEGSRTGLGIGYDTWTSGGIGAVQDVVGISIRVDGQLIAQLPVPLRPGNVYRTAGDGSVIDEVPFRNLAAADANYLQSMQTGALNTTDDLNGDGATDANDANAPQPTVDDPNWGLWIKNLTWEKLRAQLTEDSKLKITWKGVELTPAGGLAVDFSPSAGRIVFAGRTGGAWEAHHVDNIVLTTVPSDKAVLGSAAGNAVSFTVQISDSGASQVVLNSVKVKLNGNPVTVVPTQSGGLTTLTYNSPDFLPPSVENTVDIEFKETGGTTITGVRKFTVAPYVTIPASFATTATTSGSGFKAIVNQIDAARGPGDANSIANAENQNSLGFTDRTGAVLPNTADLGFANADGTYTVDVVNFDQDAGEQGNFRASGVDQLGVADANLPGIPGTSATPTDNITTEFLAYLPLKRGLNRFGVNSDDGFKLSIAPGFDAFGTVVGSFNGGRGASDSIFDFVVVADGVYPVRLLWWEGGGGANVEFFNVDVATGKKFLVNQPGGPVSARLNGRSGAYVKSFAPWPGTAAYDPNSSIKAVLVDDLTTVDQSSITLTFDGAPVTPSIVKSGTSTTVSYKPSGLAFNSAHSGVLSYKLTGATTVREIPYNFTVRKVSPFDLPANSFWVEAEDYNYESGKSVDAASTMPYAGGAYDTLAAVLGVDYNNTDGNDSDLYRPDTAPNNVNLNDNLGARWGKERPGNNEVTTNYKMGWVGNQDWGNYTRKLPVGLYKVYAALSYDGTAADQLRASLGRVTSNPALPNQTVEPLGTFRAAGSGGWGPNDLVIMRDSFGADAVVKIKNANPTTFRFTTDSGDYDYFLFAPVTGIAPKVTSASPANGAYLPRTATLSFQITDFSTAVNASSIALKLDGTTVTPTVSKADDVTSVSFNPGLLSIGSHTYELSFADTAGAAQTVTGTFGTSAFGTPQQFLVEAEDFNFDGGQVKDAASTMPYTGGAYDGLSAVAGVDYASNDGGDSNLYRLGESPNKNMDKTGDVNRGLWTNTTNFKLGWTDSGDWANYTRTYPAGDYEVWIGLSHGDGPSNATALKASLQAVTSDPTVGNQTVTQLGTVVGPGTGGWGVNRQLQFKNADGAPAVISLGGKSTLRVTMDSGDFDYFVLIPGVKPVSSKFTSTVLNANGTITITWTGGGVLQAGESINGPFQDIAGATSPYTFTPAANQLFGRIKN
jgi:hypothetical protein